LPSTRALARRLTSAVVPRGALAFTVTAVLVTIATSSTAAAQSTITFETAPLGPGFTGPVTEAGFTYAKVSGDLFVSSSGNPGRAIEGTLDAAGGVLGIRRAAGLAFVFDGLDYSARRFEGQGSQTLLVTGLFGGVTVGTAVFTVTANNAGAWTTFAAGTLGAVSLDELRITLNAGRTPDFSFVQGVDNVRLTATTSTVPEPGTWALLGTGLLAVGGVARRKRVG
jgi:hypothetical protein